MHESLKPYLDRVETGHLKMDETEDLVLFGYTDQCTFERAWDPYTEAARGIIFEKATGKVVARPFSKFFNYEEQPLSNERKLEITDGRYYLQEKMDGSLGIIFWWENSWNVATRGSFFSEQAMKGYKLLKNYRTEYLTTTLTYLVEIIYPENKIIVPYGREEKLVLLAARNTENGHYIRYSDLVRASDFLHMPRAPAVELCMARALEAKKTIPYSQEGWVAVFHDGFRLKIKGDDYMRLAKFKANLSPIAVWEAMMNGTINEMTAACPDEILDELEAVCSRLTKDLQTIADRSARRGMGKVYWNRGRKDVAVQIQACPEWMQGSLFSRLSGKGDPVKLQLKLLRPTGNQFVDVERFTG